jgi:hypothetical protein
VSDPLNPRCVVCSVNPARFGKAMCTACEEAERPEPIIDRDTGDEHIQEVS